MKPFGQQVSRSWLIHLTSHGMIEYKVSMKVLVFLFTSVAIVRAATTYSIDINDADNVLTAPGWTGLNAVHSGNGGSVDVGGVVFGIASSDGARLRGSTASPNPDALVGDFAFDDGGNEAIILLFGAAGDLAAGTWQVEVWSYDSSFITLGDQILGLRTNGSENADATIDGMLQGNGIVTNNMASSSSGPAASFTFLSDGASSYDIFLRENNANNRTRLNAVRLTQIPEPSSALLLGLGATGWIFRRRRS